MIRAVKCEDILFTYIDLNLHQLEVTNALYSTADIIQWIKKAKSKHLHFILLSIIQFRITYNIVLSPSQQCLHKHKNKQIL